MSDAYCPHGEDVNLECPPCERAREQGHAPRPPRVVRLTPARFSSNCAACFGLILPGDRIGPLPDTDEFGCETCVRELS